VEFLETVLISIDEFVIIQQQVGEFGKIWVVVISVETLMFLLAGN